jgi:hypothetical protein
MDVHRKVEGLSPEKAAGAHQRDLEIQSKHGVNYMKYWVDTREGRVYCLVEAPSKEAAIAVHKESHGLLADEINEVTEGA